ncbi:hypothetical protein N8D56_09775 [Devosia sp. A8/3-2]|nr:hypothetical protein N8D56_09775 [Devosia sp. A8/3-2]
MAEVQSLVASVETALAKTHYMIIAAATIALAVVAFTGAIIATSVFTDDYANYALYSVLLGGTAGALGVFALGAEEAALNQAKYVKIQFEFGPRAEIEKAKTEFDSIAKSFWFRWGLPLIGLCASLSGVLAILAFCAVVKP